MNVSKTWATPSSSITIRFSPGKSSGVFFPLANVAHVICAPQVLQLLGIAYHLLPFGCTFGRRLDHYLSTLSLPGERHCDVVEV